MADIALALRSDRWLDEVILAGSKANIDGDQADTWVPPAHLGHLAIMEIQLFVGSIATKAASAFEEGILMQVTSPDGSTTVDIIQVPRWRNLSATAVAAHASPDPLVEVKAGERIYINFAEIDTNAAPTGDLSVFVKAVRVRPQVVSEQPQPLRLVR